MFVLLFNISLILIYGTIITTLRTLTPKNKRLIFFVVAFLHLIFLYIFKDPTEFPDLDEYEIYLKNLTTSFTTYTNERADDRAEIGWYLLNKFTRIILGDNIIFIVLFSASVTLISYFVTINRYSRNVVFAVFILLCTNFYPSLFVLRQHMAMPICYLTIPYILNRNFKKFLFVTFIAILFHYSAIIWIPVYFLYNLRFNKKILLWAIISFVLLAKTMEILLDNLALVLPIVASYGVDAFDGQATDGGQFKPFLFVSALLIIAYKSQGGFNSMSRIDRFCSMMLIIAFFLDIFHIIGSAFAEFSRLNLYFETCAIILIPNSIRCIKDKTIKVFITVVLAFLYIRMLSAFANYGFNLFI